jgi:hypothetical protein
MVDSSLSHATGGDGGRYPIMRDLTGEIRPDGSFWVLGEVAFRGSQKARVAQLATVEPRERRAVAFGTEAVSEPVALPQTRSLRERPAGAVEAERDPDDAA